MESLIEMILEEDFDDALTVITRVAQNSPKNKNEIIIQVRNESI